MAKSYNRKKEAWSVLITEQNIQNKKNNMDKGNVK